MRAAVCQAYGPTDGVRTLEIPPPELGRGQARVKVRAAAVNYPDVLLVRGEYQIKIPPPFVPGSELAGEVVELADDVTGLALGQRVYGSTIVGAFAEEAVVAAASLTPVPADVDDAVAAAFGVAHRTAYYALRSMARVTPGEELVVLGSGGGVGSAAVQLGSLLGAKVTAVASTEEKRAVASAMGASRVIDHTRGELRQALRDALPDGADVVIDPVGGSLAEPALRSLRWGGRFVTLGYASGEIPRIPLNLVLLKGVQILGFQFYDFAVRMPAERAQGDEELARLLAAKKAFPHIGARFKLEDAAQALRWVAEGRAVGKVVLEI